MMHVRCASLFSPECTLSVSSSISGGSKRRKEESGNTADFLRFEDIYIELVA